MIIDVTAALAKIKTKLQTFIQSIRLVGLLDFLINLKAKDKFNPTLEESLVDAADPKNNWSKRLGLDKLTSFGMPVWLMFCLIISGIALIIGGEALINVLTISIRFISNFYLLAILGGILYLIWKKFKG